MSMFSGARNFEITGGKFEIVQGNKISQGKEL
jgi:hypothetical protein